MGILQNLMRTCCPQDLTVLLAADHSEAGISIDGQTAAVNLVFGNLAFLNGNGKFAKTNTQAAGTTAGELVIILETINADATGKVFKEGYLRDDDFAFTVGAVLYVGETDGTITETKPTDAGDQVRICGYAHSATIIYFHPSSTIVEL